MEIDIELLFCPVEEQEERNKKLTFITPVNEDIVEVGERPSIGFRKRRQEYLLSGLSKPLKGLMTANIISEKRRRGAK